MESKLPKPSGLKRPQAVLKSILPTDRIKSNIPNVSSGFANKSISTSCISGSGSMIRTHQPLTRDISNMTNGSLQRKERASSPEPLSTNKQMLNSRIKLRRSRSACDIREIPSFKRMESSLSTIPAKSARFVINAMPAPRPIRNFRNASNTATIVNSNANAMNATTTSASATKRTVSSVRAQTGREAPAAAATKRAAAGSGTTANPPKRIAPYDFKARFNDLLEKHKTLKAKYEKQCEAMGEFETMPAQLEDTQSKLITTETKLNNISIENESLQRQVKSQNSKIDSLNHSLGKTKDQLAQLQTEYQTIKAEHTDLSSEVLILREQNESLLERNSQLNDEIAQCKEQLFISNMDRKELHNTVLDLRGNIRVFCRVRPSLSYEEDRMLCGWSYIDESTLEIQGFDGQGKNKTNSFMFNFDQVFHPNSDQTDIFEMVSPLIQSAMDGYNICIFAYGQTGSGKTYTMDGVPGNIGVIPRTVDLLFDSIKNYKNIGWEYEIKVTFLEIYNEVLYDLLSNEQKDLDIRMCKTNKNDIYVSNLTEETVTTANRLRELMHIAKMNRATASTVGNERSSRSHAVTKVQLIGRHDGKQEISIGSINLVDLAGSESPKTSIRMNETKNINRSLSELTNVILALLQKQDHIPYRNSKLTHLLMPSLGGNSKTLMFINVSPFQDCFHESLKSLRFAASVNSCKMTKAKRNRYLNSASTSSSSFEK